jgi:hypothetical protein
VPLEIRKMQSNQKRDGEGVVGERKRIKTWWCSGSQEKKEGLSQMLEN